MGSTDPAGFNEGVLCLVKYMVDNDNTYHDLRIQIYKMAGPDDIEEAELESGLRPRVSMLFLTVLSLAAWLM